VTSTIETRAKYHAGKSAALYIESFVSPLLEGMENQTRLTPEQATAIDRIITAAPARMKIVSIKIWSVKGDVIYSADRDLIGMRFPLTPGLSRAVNGTVTVEFEELDHEESRWERAKGISLIEVYAPIHSRDGRVVGAAEFYEDAGELSAELQEHKQDAWIVSGLVCTAMILALFGIVARGGRTIAQQRRSLDDRVTELSRLLEQNTELHHRVQRASQLGMEETEASLRRLSADLHDGPAQLISIALLRLGVRNEADSDGEEGSAAEPDLAVVRSILTDAMRDVRNLCEGLQLPEIEKLSLAEALYIMISDHERRTGTDVAASFADLPDEAPQFVKAGLCRFVQEGLNNAFRHAGGRGQRVSAWVDGSSVFVQVEDSGPGMAQHEATGGHVRLGLAGLWNRIEGLGGSMRILSTSEGTKITAEMPMAAEGGERP
jgi:signal transduction histidine kinase